jgi:hypothetical protein
MLQYKTKIPDIISLFKNNLNTLNNGNLKFDLIDYGEDSVSLRMQMHIITMKLKADGEMVNVIISFTFEGKDNIGQQFAKIGADKASCRIVEFINESLEPSAITESANQYLIQKQADISSGNKNMVLYGVGIVVLFFVIYYGIMWWSEMEADRMMRDMGF